MKLEHTDLDVRVIGSSRPADAPKVILWIAPRGLPIICRDLADAATGAQRYAGEHPGSLVGVYELIGTAYIAPTYPEMERVERESEVLVLTVDNGCGNG